LCRAQEQKSFIGRFLVKMGDNYQNYEILTHDEAFKEMNKVIEQVQQQTAVRMFL
jgi:hypothetical protein